MVEPPSSAQPGERITFPGYEGNPDELLNPKKKVWETLQVDLHTNEELVACYKNIPLTSSARQRVQKKEIKKENNLLFFYLLPFLFAVNVEFALCNLTF